MNGSNYKDQILNYFKQKGKARVEDLRREFPISRAMIHRHLKKLVDEKQVEKIGRAPLVFYVYKPKLQPKLADQKLADPKIIKFIDDHYLYTSPLGEMLYGFRGFIQWAEKTNPQQPIDSLAQEYVKIRTEALSHYNSDDLIEATDKFHKTFPDFTLEKVFYADFYSLPKFGKTILGQKVLYAKQSQSLKLIKEIASQINPLIDKLLEHYQIQAVGILPPTIPRQIQFLKELEHSFHLKVPKITFTKAYLGDIPVAQKSLSKLNERVENAEKTIFIKNPTLNFESILLIDDAVGSGATLNETAKKLKTYAGVKHVYGFGIVGSYKGFDVISEV